MSSWSRDRYNDTPFAGARKSLKTVLMSPSSRRADPVEGNGGYTNDYNTSASVAAESLKKFGVPADLVQMVPSRVIARERTYSSAVALRDWFREHNMPVHSFNVLTEDAHARGTRLLYQKAFGKNVAVGVIAVSNPDYNPKTGGVTATVPEKS